MAQALQIDLTANDQQQLFFGLVNELDKWDLDWVAEMADVSPGTLRRWSLFETLHPRLTTVYKVSKAIGYQLRLVKQVGYKRPVASKRRRKNHLRSVK